jgi:hypothetical protein
MPFQFLTYNERSILMEICSIVSIKMGDLVYLEGTSDRNFYFVMKGCLASMTGGIAEGDFDSKELEVSGRSKNPILAVYPPSSCFGILEAQYNLPRISSLVAQEDSTVLKISWDDSSIVRKMSPSLEASFEGSSISHLICKLLVQPGSFFHGLPFDYKLSEMLARRFKLFHIQKGESLQERLSDQFFVVVDGAISQKSRDIMFTKGQFFGCEFAGIKLENNRDLEVISNSILLTINQSDQFDLLREYPEFEQYVLRKANSERAEFLKFLENSKFSRNFILFMNAEYAYGSENVRFLRKCKDYGKAADRGREKIADSIVKDYVTHSTLFVSLAARQNCITRYCNKEFTPDLFSNLQQEVINTIYGDMYPRYREYQLHNESEAKGRSGTGKVLYDVGKTIWSPFEQLGSLMSGKKEKSELSRSGSLADADFRNKSSYLSTSFSELGNTTEDLGTEEEQTMAESKINRSSSTPISRDVFPPGPAPAPQLSNQPAASGHVTDVLMKSLFGDSFKTLKLNKKKK